MTQRRNHLTAEEWTDYQYGEGRLRAELESHLADCPDCASMARELAGDLAYFDALLLSSPMPERNAAYGEVIWGSLEASLAPYRAKAHRTMAKWRWGAGLGVATAVLAVVAFYSGRLWEHQHVDRNSAMSGHAGEPNRQSVVLFVISDHLDRSQRLLAELDDPDAAASDAALQKTARELLMENRLYRQSTAEPGIAKDVQEDATLKTILDDLEPVLVELANQPEKLDRKELLRVSREMNTGGLLFEIHVLRARVPGGQTSESLAQKGGKA